MRKSFFICEVIGVALHRQSKSLSQDIVSGRRRLLRSFHIELIGLIDYRFTNIAFEEAKAIMEMKGTADIVRVFSNPELEHIMFEYLDIERQDFAFAPVKDMHVGQDALAFKLYITPSGTQPIVLGEDGQQAKKIKNLYIYCQHVVRLK